ncbi:MAG: DNA alkylation repair protein [Vicinamibacterales bacterium]
MASDRASTIRREMRRLTNRSRAAALQRYFKTGPGEYGAGDRFLGIRVPVLRKLAARNRTLSLRDLSSLLASPWHEERLLALFILVRQYATADPAQREAIFRLYMRRTGRINNWDLVDCSAGYIVGAHLRGRKRTRLLRLARSRALWERRIAIMATSHYIQQNDFDYTLRVARLLRDDPHDLIHKAVGWMLREIGKRDPAVEERFLRRHATRMPRTMLRYAIERFPPKVRRRYLDS